MGSASDPLGTDNAGGGQRGLRATPSDALLAAVREAYGLDGGPDPVDLGGSSNLNLLVGAGDDRCVVRVYRPYDAPDAGAGRVRGITAGASPSGGLDA